MNHKETIEDIIDAVLPHIDIQDRIDVCLVSVVPTQIQLCVREDVDGEPARYDLSDLVDDYIKYGPINDGVDGLLEIAHEFEAQAKRLREAHDEQKFLTTLPRPLR